MNLTMWENHNAGLWRCLLYFFETSFALDRNMHRSLADYWTILACCVFFYGESWIRCFLQCFRWLCLESFLRFVSWNCEKKKWQLFYVEKRTRKKLVKDLLFEPWQHLRWIFSLRNDWLKSQFVTASERSKRMIRTVAICMSKSAITAVKKILFLLYRFKLN